MDTTWDDYANPTNVVMPQRSVWDRKSYRGASIFSSGSTNPLNVSMITHNKAASSCVDILVDLTNSPLAFPFYFQVGLVAQVDSESVLITYWNLAPFFVTPSEFGGTSIFANTNIVKNIGFPTSPQQSYVLQASGLVVNAWQIFGNVVGAGAVIHNVYMSSIAHGVEV